MVDFNFKNKYNINDLVEIVRLLRQPDGCPWDREQTHESIKKNFIEETYEAIEAINKNDKELLKEELGDVLLQVCMHVQMESEIGSFSFDDVCDGICKKLIERHPHVFGDVTVNGTSDVLSNWDTIKRRSKSQRTQGDSMKKVPLELPALMRATKIQQKAKKAGMDFDSFDSAMSSFENEVKEFKDAVLNNNEGEIEDELGDVLFSLCNVSRKLDVDSEEALKSSTDKFLKRYLFVEEYCEKNGIDMKTAPMSQLDEIWEMAKETINTSVME